MVAVPTVFEGGWWCLAAMMSLSLVCMDLRISTEGRERQQQAAGPRACPWDARPRVRFLTDFGRPALPCRVSSWPQGAHCPHTPGVSHCEVSLESLLPGLLCSPSNLTGVFVSLWRKEGEVGCHLLSFLLEVP